MADKIFEDVKLTDNEISALDRMLDLIDESRGHSDNPGDITPMAFTPAAALAIGVANLAFSVYTEYGVANNQTDVAYRLKYLAADLAEIEAKAEGAPSVDILARLKNEVRTMKRSRRK